MKQSLGLHNMAPSLDFQGDVNFAPIQPLRLSADQKSTFDPSFRPDALASAASRAAQPTPREPRPSNPGSASRPEAYERQVPPRPTDQAKRELEEFYKSLSQLNVPDVEGEATAIGVPVPSAAALEAAQAAAELPSAPPVPVVPAVPAAVPQLPLREGSASPSGKVLQLHQQYLLVPVKSGLMLIDQAAARSEFSTSSTPRNCSAKPVLPKPCCFRALLRFRPRILRCCAKWKTRCGRSASASLIR